MGDVGSRIDIYWLPLKKREKAYICSSQVQVQTWEFQVWTWAELWNVAKPIIANGFVTKNRCEIILGR